MIDPAGDDVYRTPGTDLRVAPWPALPCSTVVLGLVLSEALRPRAPALPRTWMTGRGLIASALLTNRANAPKSLA